MAVPQFIWKNKDSKGSIDMYRPIALTSVFRRALVWILLREVKMSLKELDIAWGKFRGEGALATWHLT